MNRYLAAVLAGLTGSFLAVLAFGWLDDVAAVVVRVWCDWRGTPCGP